MANFNQSIDLLAIPGAKALSINDGTQDNPKMVNYICIPADLNEVKVDYSRNDKTKMVAYLKLAMRTFGKKYIDSIVASRQRNGDEVDMSKIETHEVTLNHSKEFTDAWVKAVSAAVLKEHPEWTGQNPLEKSADEAQNSLYYEVRRRINKRIGKSYAVQAEAAVRPVPANTFMPADCGVYVPGSNSAPMMAPPAGEVAIEGDLPF